MIKLFFLQPLNSSLLHITWSNTSCVRKQGRRLLCWVVSCLISANITILLTLVCSSSCMNDSFSCDLHLTANWKEVLRNYVDADQLPAVYGGSMTDPDGDPLCKTMVRFTSEQENNIPYHSGLGSIRSQLTCIMVPTKTVFNIDNKNFVLSRKSEY